MLTTTIVSMVMVDPLTRQLRHIAWSIVVNHREPPGGIRPADPNIDSLDFEPSSAEQRRAGALGLLRAYTRMIKVLQQRIDMTVDAALEEYGASYGQVAAACGVSRQAARQRRLRHHRPDEPPSLQAGPDKAASTSPVGGTSASACLPLNRPHARIPGVRVYELANEFGVESKAVMDRLLEMREFTRSASSLVPPKAARQLREEFASGHGGQGRHQNPRPGESRHRDSTPDGK